MSNSKIKPGAGTEAALSKSYVLQLYITGATPNSVRAIANVKAICEKHIAGNYTLEIIDVYKEKEQARARQIVALPMLVKLNPAPERKLIGDMSKTEKVLEALGIK